MVAASHWSAVPMASGVYLPSALILSRTAWNSPTVFGGVSFEFVEDLLVVDEAVDDRGHRHAERRLAVVGGPGALGDVGEVVHAGQVVDGGEVALLEQVERRVERAAGDDVAGGAAGKPRVERGVVLGRRIGLELHLDVGVLLLEGRDDLLVPDVGVVVAPALDGERLGRGGPGERRQRKRHRRDGIASPAQQCLGILGTHRCSFLCSPLSMPV